MKHLAQSSLENQFKAEIEKLLSKTYDHNKWEITTYENSSLAVQLKTNERIYIRIYYNELFKKLMSIFSYGGEITCDNDDAIELVTIWGKICEIKNIFPNIESLMHKYSIY